MMRRSKHRHHPSIWWRERQRAERLRSRSCPPLPPLDSLPLRALAEAEVSALVKFWAFCLTLDDYYGNPAGTLVYSGLVPVEEDRPRVWR